MSDSELIFLIERISGSFPSAVVGAIVALTFSIVLSITARRKLPIAHSVAILGFPRSGKTTLITSLFAEVLQEILILSPSRPEVNPQLIE